jgi:hypothetical protein
MNRSERTGPLAVQKEKQKLKRPLKIFLLKIIIPLEKKNITVMQDSNEIFKKKSNYERKPRE